MTADDAEKATVPGPPTCALAVAVSVNTSGAACPPAIRVYVPPALALLPRDPTLAARKEPAATGPMGNVALWVEGKPWNTVAAAEPTDGALAVIDQAWAVAVATRDSRAARQTKRMGSSAFSAIPTAPAAEHGGATASYPDCGTQGPAIAWTTCAPRTGRADM